MLLRWLATLQCQFHSTEYRTFIVVQYKGQNFHHVTVTAGALQQDGLKLLERGWQFSKWRTIAQRPRFLLKHRQVMVPVVLCVATPSVATAKQSWMLGNVLAFGKLTGLSEKLIVSHWENNYGGAVKRLNAIASPAIGGALFAAGWLAAPLVACGLLKVVYDVVLWRAFRKYEGPSS